MTVSSFLTLIVPALSIQGSINGLAPKSPGSSATYTIDLQAWLAPGDYLVSATLVSNLNDLTIGPITLTGTQAAAVISQGTVNTTYGILGTFLSDMGETLSFNFNLPVVPGGVMTTQPAIALGAQGPQGSTISVQNATGPTINWANTAVARVTISQSTTFQMTGGVDGQRLTLEVTQGSAGSHTVSFGSSVIFGTDLTGFSASTTPGLIDVFGFQCVVSTSTIYRAVAFARGFTE